MKLRENTEGYKSSSEIKEYTQHYIDSHIDLPRLVVFKVVAAELNADYGTSLTAGDIKQIYEDSMAFNKDTTEQGLAFDNSDFVDEQPIATELSADKAYAPVFGPGFGDEPIEIDDAVIAEAKKFLEHKGFTIRPRIRESDSGIVYEEFDDDDLDEYEEFDKYVDDNPDEFSGEDFDREYGIGKYYENKRYREYNRTYKDWYRDHPVKKEEDYTREDFSDYDWEDKEHWTPRMHAIVDEENKKKVSESLDGELTNAIDKEGAKVKNGVLIWPDGHIKELKPTEAREITARKQEGFRGPRRKRVKQDDNYNNVYAQIEALTNTSARLGYLAGSEAAAEENHTTVEYAMEVARDVAEDYLDTDSYKEQKIKFKRKYPAI
jgi:hypothetical protein